MSTVQAVEQIRKIADERDDYKLALERIQAFAAGVVPGTKETDAIEAMAAMVLEKHGRTA